MTVTEQIENAIADSGGNVRDALNDVLAGRDVAVALLRAENAKALALIVALEEIRAILWPDAIDTRETRAIDKIARNALKAAGEMATTIEED